MQERPNEWQRGAKIPQCGPDERPAEGQKGIPDGPCAPLKIKTNPREGQQRPRGHGCRESIPSEASEGMSVAKV